MALAVSFFPSKHDFDDIGFRRTMRGVRLALSIHLVTQIRRVVA
jgi:hypothetical protein